MKTEFITNRSLEYFTFAGRSILRIKSVNNYGGKLNTVFHGLNLAPWVSPVFVFTFCFFDNLLDWSSIIPILFAGKPRQGCVLCGFSFAGYLEKCFTQIYRVCMEMPFLLSSVGHKHGGRQVTETFVSAEFCYLNEKLLF